MCYALIDKNNSLDIFIVYAYIELSKRRINMKTLEYQNGVAVESYDFTAQKTVSDIQKKKESLEFELAIAMQNVIAEWQKQTGLNIAEVIPHVSQGHSDGVSTKLIVTDVKVVLDYRAG